MVDADVLDRGHRRGRRPAESGPDAGHQLGPATGAGPPWRCPENTGSWNYQLTIPGISENVRREICLKELWRARRNPLAPLDISAKLWRANQATRSGRPSGWYPGRNVFMLVRV